MAAAALAIAVMDGPTSAAAVRSERPRVLISEPDIARMRSRMTAAPYRDVYQALKNRVDGWTAPTTNRYVIGQQIQAIVMVALVENYSAAYVGKVDQWIRHLFETQGVVSLAASGEVGAIWGSSDTILGVAIALDWLYPALDAARRTRYATHLRDYQDAVIGQQGGMTRDGSRSDYSNQFYYFDGMFAISGLALSGEGVDDAAATRYVNAFEGYVRQNMLPTVNQVAGTNGGWHEGLGYVNRGMTAFATALEAWRVGTGEDLFPQASGLRQLGKWAFYSTQPDGHVVNVGDVSAWPTGWGQDTGKRSALLGARFRDGYSQLHGEPGESRRRVAVCVLLSTVARRNRSGSRAGLAADRPAFQRYRVGQYAQRLGRVGRLRALHVGQLLLRPPAPRSEQLPDIPLRAARDR